MSRDRRGRFTAERTTETTTTTVTERVTVEPPRPPLPAGGPEPLFTHLLSYPPAGARWGHPAFIAAEAARAAAGFRDGVGAFPPRHGRAPEPFTVPFDDTAPVPVIRVPVARTYPELEPAALALEFEAEVTREFTEADAEQLAAQLTMGRSI